MNIDASVLDSYPVIDADLDAILDYQVREDDHVFVVLDDDPTGVQCVHDIRVYTDWSYASMKEAFEIGRAHV